MNNKNTSLEYILKLKAIINEETYHADVVSLPPTSIFHSWILELSPNPETLDCCSVAFWLEGDGFGLSVNNGAAHLTLDESDHNWNIICSVFKAALDGRLSIVSKPLKPNHSTVLIDDKYLNGKAFASTKYKSNEVTIRRFSGYAKD